ncbi:MAG: FecR domain-containing protein, partial [Gammaproteobacteria bacterium]|nr:FecR domain-containing protein [Gammaproteobacteria bacterium]
MNRKQTGLYLGLLLVFLLFPMAALADGVGKAIFVIGNVTLVSANGKSGPLKKGHILNPGDRIDTSAKGQVQIRMIDGAFIGIRPNSSFEVTDYQLDEKNPENQKSEFNLLKGGFRAITGKIGKTNKNAYKVVTPVATIGIRGTDYVAMLCADDCGGRSSGKKHKKEKNGLYVGVLRGGVHVKNAASSIDIDRNQYSYVAGLEEKPVRLKKPPAFLMFETVDPSVDEENHARNNGDRGRHGNR